ncbi:GNAT family N-acetyltransferase [Wolbachia endosymbiont (group A) of Sicus ferrugineus]|uniref:GNAT family N-acetyltransferase n=1 Tax=Wolbachia endosymbiont (group A) of Sicus ferrugineus TaxID=2954056 RepID=UPI00222E4BD9|nr:GNAT family N-acetyltransferase [Wolbachia endosymbiont (group A) of Sicus ferrugineus]
MQIIPGGKEEQESLDKVLVEFNLTQIPCYKNPPSEDMCYVIRNSDNELVAGVYGSLIMDNVLSISTLCVKESERKKGYGKQLLQKIEEEAKFKGACLASLNTFDFQAPDFYLKLGYEIFAVLDDCPAKGHKRYYLKKSLLIGDH